MPLLITHQPPGPHASCLFLALSLLIAGGAQSQTTGYATSQLQAAAVATPQQSADGVSQEPLRYRISFSNRAHHEAEVELTVSGHPLTAMHLRMSRTSPGRYRLHDFARNVYSVRAEDSSGRTLPVERTDLHGWQVSGHNGAAVLRYTVFGDHISGTYSAIDETHAHLNPPSVFAWIRGFEHHPVELEVIAPRAEWKIATQLEPTDDPHRFRARDLWDFMDAPIEASDFVDVRWQMSDTNGPQEFRMTFHHTGDQDDIDEYVASTQRLVAEAAGVFGELPRFDHGRYTFMVDYLPWGTGDAMEHRNSTPLTSSSSIRDHAPVLLETLVHEFFHAWNVERLRPASLEPFDFENASFSPDLWFAEGFTNYYDGLLLVRAGDWSRERYLENLGAMLNRLFVSPAPRFGSPIDMSQQAAFRDRASWRDPQNSDNTYLHYYSYGDAIGLALDLELRRRDSTLDRLMRTLWRSHGSSEQPYRLADFESALAQVSDPEFASHFVASYIIGSEMPDYAALLRSAGFVLRPPAGRQHSVGEVDLLEAKGGLRVIGRTLIGTPLYDAGVDQGDQLVELDGKALRKTTTLQRLVQRATLGSELALRVRSRGGLRQVALRIDRNPKVEVVPGEQHGESPSEAQRTVRELWLASSPGAKVVSDPAP